MSIEERLRDHLESTTAHLRAPDRLDAVRRRGRRRQIRTRLVTVLGATSALAVALTLGTDVISDPSELATVETGPTSTISSADAETFEEVTPVTEALGVLVADVAGITLLDAEGNETHALSSDDLYEEVAAAFPDQRGGLVFQHAVTPEPWPQGSLMRLKVGGDRPEVLVPSPDDGVLVPVGPARSLDGRALFVFLSDIDNGAGTTTRIVVVDLDEGTSSSVMRLENRVEVSSGGQLIAMVDREDFSCPRIELMGVYGEPFDTVLPDCLPPAAGIALAHDSPELAVLADDRLEIIDVTTGETLAEHSIPGAYMVVSGPGGWAIRTPTETRLIDSSTDLSLPPVEDGWVVPYGHPFDLPDGATLGSGSDGVPCEPVAVTAANQALPPEVAATRRSLLEMAAACDYAGLSERALADETTISFGEPADPAAFWVAEGRTGEDPLATLVRLVAEPGVEDANGIWTWPSEFTEPDSTYLGYRVGIAADGRWQFFVAGD